MKSAIEFPRFLTHKETHQRGIAADGQLPQEEYRAVRLWMWVWVTGLLVLGSSSVWASSPSPNLERVALPVSSVGWLMDTTAGKPAAGGASDLPAPMSQGTRPPIEWSLAVFQTFSGMIVAGVSSFVVQTIVELAIVGPAQVNVQAETSALSGIVGTLVSLATIPWLVAGTVYGLGRLSNNYRSSFWWSLLGAYVGEAVALGVGLLINFVDQSESKSTSRLLRFLLDGLFIGFGTVLFYTLFRYSVGNFQQIGALIQYRQGVWSWGVPLPHISQYNDTTTVSVPVLSGSF